MPLFSSSFFWCSVHGLLGAADSENVCLYKSVWEVHCRFVKNKGAGVCVAKDAKVVVTGCLSSQNGTCALHNSSCSCSIVLHSMVMPEACRVGHV